MTLEKYRQRQGLRISQLAVALEVDRTTIWRWLTGARIPTPQMILRIQEWSRGAVRANDWIDLA